MEKEAIAKLVDLRMEEAISRLREHIRIASNTEGLCCFEWMTYHPTDAALLQCPKCGVTKPKVIVPWDQSKSLI